MIKPEKSAKIRKKTPKIFQKTPKFRRKICKKNPKNLPSRFARELGGLPAAKLGDIFQNFFSGGYFGYIPLGHVWVLWSLVYIKFYRYA